MTGLPGSGKTTIALEVEHRLKEMGRNVEILDGDEVRKGLSSDLGFSKEDRQRHARRVTFVAKVLTRNGVIVLVGLISPFRDFRQYAREEIGGFIEVFQDEFQSIKFPIEVKNIRRAEDPLFSVAKGCLVASLSDV